MIAQHIRTFVELYVENNHTITDADIQKFICGSLRFGEENVSRKDIRDILAEMAEQDLLIPNLVLNDIVIYNKRG
jgi:hypothetical protein